MGRNPWSVLRFATESATSPTSAQVARRDDALSSPARAKAIAATAATAPMTKMAVPPSRKRSRTGTSGAPSAAPTRSTAYTRPMGNRVRVSAAAMAMPAG